MSGSWPPNGWFDLGNVIDAPVLWAPPKYPGDTLDYTIDITDAIQVGTDTITAASAAVAPSGAGELTLSRMTAVNATHFVTLFLTGGQPTRVYTIPVLVSMSDGRTMEFLVRIRVSPQLASDQPQAVPSAGYGTTVNATVT